MTGLGGAGDQTQGFMHSGQAVYQLTNILSSLYFLPTNLEKKN